MIFINHIPPFRAGRYNAACHCVQQGNGNYVVWCVNCGEGIGAMTGETVARAIMITAGRGGVLCPGCRKCTCDECGQTYNPSYVFGDYDGLRVCYFCHKDKVNSETARSA